MTWLIGTFSCDFPIDDGAMITDGLRQVNRIEEKKREFIVEPLRVVAFFSLEVHFMVPTNERVLDRTYHSAIKKTLKGEN